jgi:hypothetical protein
MTRVQLWKARGTPAYLVCRIDEETGCYLQDDANTVLFQTDWEFPALAATFGWNISKSQTGEAGYRGAFCSHSGTDGTVECSVCGVTPQEFISDAIAFLNEHLGAIAPDPGYFEVTA